MVTPFLLSKEKEPLEALKCGKGTRNIHNLSQAALGAKVLIKGIYLFKKSTPPEWPITAIF